MQTPRPRRFSRSFSAAAARTLRARAEAGAAVTTLMAEMARGGAPSLPRTTGRKTVCSAPVAAFRSARKLPTRTTAGSGAPRASAATRVAMRRRHCPWGARHALPRAAAAMRACAATALPAALTTATTTRAFTRRHPGQCGRGARRRRRRRRAPTRRATRVWVEARRRRRRAARLRATRVRAKARRCPAARATTRACASGSAAVAGGTPERLWSVNVGSIAGCTAVIGQSSPAAPRGQRAERAAAPRRIKSPPKPQSLGPKLPGCVRRRRRRWARRGCGCRDAASLVVLACAHASGVRMCAARRLGDVSTSQS